MKIMLTQPASWSWSLGLTELGKIEKRIWKFFPSWIFEILVFVGRKTGALSKADINPLNLLLELDIVFAKHCTLFINIQILNLTVWELLPKVLTLTLYVISMLCWNLKSIISLLHWWFPLYIPKYYQKCMFSHQ